jgi:hypothetical protein
LSGSAANVDDGAAVFKPDQVCEVVDLSRRVPRAVPRVLIHGGLE